MPGIADLPLHGGHVPRWMLRVMTRLAGAIVGYMVEVRGPNSVVAMLSDPYWFQAFNNVIGMDWDSSGSTTVVTGILKTITWKNPGLGILVLGGKGARMRRVPEEAVEAEKLLGVDAGSIATASKLAARADSVFLQDGYDLYHHAVVVSSEGDFVVVQQGMNTALGMARRYHVTRADVTEPHSGVAGVEARVELNATKEESRGALRAYIDALSEGPRRLLRLIAEANAVVEEKPTLLSFTSEEKAVPRPRRAYYRPVRIDKGLESRLELLARAQATTPLELALSPGLGPRTLRALALVADIVYGVPTSTRDSVTHPLDPFAYAYAIGGKDGVPYPFDAKTAAEVIQVMVEALERIRRGDRRVERSLMRLRAIARSLGLGNMV